MSGSDICPFWVEAQIAGEQFVAFLHLGHPDQATFQIAEAELASVLEQDDRGRGWILLPGCEGRLGGNVPLLGYATGIWRMLAQQHYFYSFTYKYLLST